MIQGFRRRYGFETQIDLNGMPLGGPYKSSILRKREPFLVVFLDDFVQFLDAQ